MYIQTTWKTYKYIGSPGCCRHLREAAESDIDKSWGFGSRRLNIGETKQFYHTFYFNYTKDINFHNFSIAKITKPDFPRLKVLENTLTNFQNPYEPCLLHTL
jgi:hypothetical protein